jgi:hypothetical protein
MPEFTDLDRLSDEQIRKLMDGVKALNATPEGHRLVQRTIHEHRSGKFAGKNQARPIPAPADFNPLEQIYGSEEENQ